MWYKHKIPPRDPTPEMIEWERGNQRVKLILIIAAIILIPYTIGLVSLKVYRDCYDKQSGSSER